MQADPRYWQSLQRYQRVLLQRNRLLRRWREAGAPPSAREEVSFWTQEMVQHGAYLIVARRRLVTTLAPTLDRLHAQLAGASQRLSLSYCPQVRCSPDDDEESVAYTFRQALAAAWPRELDQGYTLVGPNRDDLGFALGEMDLGVYGSRGQQRTATIALKLAQVEWLRQQSGEEPVVLLDDVLSELDPERRGYLQGWLLEGGHQVVVTTTDLQVFLPIILGQATIYRVEAGRWALQGMPQPGGAEGAERL